MRIEDLDEATLARLPSETLRYLAWQARWTATARPKQLLPPEGWTEAGVMAGRGFGKTLTGAQWLAAAAYEDTLALDRAVIAPTYADVKFTCFQGPAGLLKVIPPELVEDYNSTDLIIRVRGVTGKPVTIRGFTAEKPERLRGPQHADIWCFAAGTPVLMADGSERPIEAVTPGEYVATRFGARCVTAAGRSGNDKPRVRLEYGETSLIATSDHPMLTPSGWMAAGDLREGDELWSVCGLQASRGGVDQTDITRIDALGGIFTAKYMNKPTALSQLGTMFITATKTARTTTQIILRPFRTPSIGGNTPQARPKHPSSVLRCLRTSGWLGRLYRRAVSPVANVASSLKHAVGGSLARSAALGALSGGVLPLLPASVGFAEAAVVGSMPPRPIRSFAQGVATFGQGGLRLIKAQGRARVVRLFSFRDATTQSSASGLALSRVRVKNVERLPTLDPVYDLTVEGVHEFIAGGVVVHNCDELAAWLRPDETWDMAMMGLRLGPAPRVLWTTTPKPIDLVRRLTEPKDGRLIVRGSTYENKDNLPQTFFDQLAQYEGTVIGRQELEGELIDPEESGIIKRSWFRLWPAQKPLPAFDWIVMSLDTAFTEATIDKRTGDPDYSACTVWGGFSVDGSSHVLLLDCWQDRLGMPELIARVKKELNVAYGDDQDTALIKPMFGAAKPITSGRKVDMVIIEDKGSGISLRQMLDREGITAYAYNPGRADKLSRLHIVSPIFARRQIWLPESDKYPKRPRTWADPLVAQLCSFTGGGSIKHDDFVDSTTQAIRLLMDKGLLSAVKLQQKPLHEPTPPRVVVNPYSA